MVKKYSVCNDLEIIRYIKKDDCSAFTELYNRYWEKLLVVSLNRLNNLEAAQEIVQDVFTSIWERRSELDIKSTVSSYLAVAVKYRVIDLLASKAYKVKKTEIQEAILSGFEPSVEEQYFEKELIKRIEETIQNLPEKCQLVFRLSRESGLTYKQIAEKLKISEKTVEAHMSKALKELRLNLGMACILLTFFMNQK
ncbi:RNA polymerase sigma-70 factor [Pedobacter sp.]|uniref:RNA polymerase sigma-70 factor n=1 Tax=Pedobacter sp. TaxID=1411316 RepID=UPI003D7F6458